MSHNAVKGRQAKLRDPHDTTRVINVSISVSFLSASHRIRLTKCNGGTDDYQRHRQDLVRGEHETRRRLRRPRPLSDLWEANPAWPLNFRLRRVRPQTPAGASFLDPLETFVLKTP